MRKFVQVYKKLLCETMGKQQSKEETVIFAVPMLHGWSKCINIPVPSPIY